MSSHTVLFWIALLIFVGGCSHPAGKAAVSATAAFVGPADQWHGCTVELRDVQGLWGGTAIHLRASGGAVVRIVDGRTEERFAVTLSAEESAAVRTLCVDADLLTAPVKNRPGVPDEARPVIVITNAQGMRREVGKWANDKVPAFDRVYDGLLRLRKKTEKLQPEYEGPYQPDWKPSSAFTIKCRKAEDTVGVSMVAGGGVVLDVTSPSGVGGATVERIGEHWPDELVLRMHLRGLESLRISGGGTVLRISVLSHSGNPRLLHLARNGEQEGPELAEGEAGWTNVLTLDAHGRTVNGLPGEGGRFELAVPQTVLSDKEKTLTLEWIDFYRR